MIENDSVYNETDYTPRSETDNLNFLSHLLGKNLEINPKIISMQKRILTVNNLNALFSFLVIIGSMFEYENYYFKSYYTLNDDGVYVVKDLNEVEYKGEIYRSLYSIFCLITAVLSIYSTKLEYNMKILQGTIVEGILIINLF